VKAPKSPLSKKARAKQKKLKHATVKQNSSPVNKSREEKPFVLPSVSFDSDDESDDEKVRSGASRRAHVGRSTTYARTLTRIVPPPPFAEVHYASARVLLLWHIWQQKGKEEEEEEEPEVQRRDRRRRRDGC